MWAFQQKMYLNMKNKVLVLLSTYNGEKYVYAQLESILSQKNVELSVLCRDDGSEDNTFEIVLEFVQTHKNITLIKGNNIGCAKSYYFLLEEAYRLRDQFDYFSFSDQDDVWLENKLKRAIDCLEKEEIAKQQPYLYCSNLSIVDSNLRFIKLMNGNNVSLSKAGLLVKNVCTGCTMVFNRSVLDFFNQYKPDSFRLHDIWLADMCVFFGKIYYDNESYILYRQHRGNAIGSKYSLEMRLKSKWKSFKSLNTQHFRENDAKKVLEVYNGILKPEDKEIISMIANLRTFKSRIRLLNNAKKLGFIMRSSIDNFWFKVRIILGVV